MSLFKKARSNKSLSVIRIVSAVLVLGVLVLVVAESAKYLYVVQIPESVSSKIEPSVDKLASVLGVAKSSLESLDVTGEEAVDDPESIGETDIGKEVPEVINTIVKVAILSDSHNDLENLNKALSKVQERDVDQIMFLGDYTDWGELSNLERSKEIMDKFGIPYISLPGDHDLGETRDESNFVKVFGKPYGMLNADGVKMTYFDNSKNYTEIGADPISWFDKEIKDTDFLFLSQPLVTESMSRVMGIVDGVKDASVYTQNIQLLEAVRSSDVKVIVSGDLHQFTKFKDPAKEGLWHYTVGAVLKSQSLEKLNLQSPRFAVLTIKKDLSYQIEDITID